MMEINYDLNCINSTIADSIAKSNNFNQRYPDYLIEAVAKAENDFFLKIAKEILGRDFDPSMDVNDFQLLEYSHLNKTMLAYKGIECGEVIRDYTSMKWEFIPKNQME